MMERQQDELRHTRDEVTLLQRWVASGLLVTIWLLIAASPLLLVGMTAMMGGWFVLGDEGLLHHWPLLLLAGGVVGALAGCLLAERIRRRYGLLPFYARLLNNPELNR
ncbi:hypothetical protein HQ400_08290 [Aeromonas jandaei]|nr:hypothetical protein HQ400_08290 [Aeromonas jandaei]